MKYWVFKTFEKENTSDKSSAGAQIPRTEVS